MESRTATKVEVDLFGPNGTRVTYAGYGRQHAEWDGENFLKEVVFPTVPCNVVVHGYQIYDFQGGFLKEVTFEHPKQLAGLMDRLVLNPKPEQKPNPRAVKVSSKVLTVGAIRKLLEGMPDDLPCFVPEEREHYYQEIEKVTIEELPGDLASDVLPHIKGVLFHY